MKCGKMIYNYKVQGDSQMNITDFVDRQQLDSILSSWSKATGMATIALDANGEYISGEIGFTDFCMKYTRGCEKGAKRCIKCDQQGKDVYYCHAGLMDFSKDIVVDGQYVGKIIGGQILPKEPDENKFRAIAEELGIDPDAYIAALRKVKISSEESIQAGADLLGLVVNSLVENAYYHSQKNRQHDTVQERIGDVESYISNINSYTKNLDKLEKNQKILALNASIEAARAGEVGRGFAIVANKVGSLAADFGSCNREIRDELEQLTDAMGEITGHKLQ